MGDVTLLQEDVVHWPSVKAGLMQYISDVDAVWNDNSMSQSAKLSRFNSLTNALGA